MDIALKRIKSAADIDQAVIPAGQVAVWVELVDSKPVWMGKLSDGTVVMMGGASGGTQASIPSMVAPALALSLANPIGGGGPGAGLDILNAPTLTAIGTGIAPDIDVTTIQGGLTA